MTRCYYCGCLYEHINYALSEDFKRYTTCDECSVKGIEMAKIRYNIFIIEFGRAINLHMDGEHKEQYIEHLQQMHPFEPWLKLNPFYKFMYDVGMENLEGPLGQFTKPVKME